MTISDKQGIFSRRRAVGMLTHIIFIVIICILPEMLMRMSFPHRYGGMPWWWYVKSAIMVGVFYINYFLIFDNTLMRRRRWWTFFVWNILLILAASLLMHYMWQLGVGSHRAPRHGATLSQWQQLLATSSFIMRDSVMLILIVSLSVAVKMSTRWLDLEHRQQQLIASQRESELENLRSQLNPHFLFNTLNSIYALIEISPREAQQAIHELSKMLRYVVYDNPEKVELTREIDFIENYIALMRLRMGNRPIEVEISNTAPATATIAPLLSVALIENAFKHGNTSEPTNPIKISIAADDQKIDFRTENSVDASLHLDGNSGVGLSNLAVLN